MRRPYRQGRRHRPGRPPPNRASAAVRRASRQGFTPGPFGSWYRLLLPDLGGREKRDFFNGICHWTFLAGGLCAAVAGFFGGGVLGAVLGFGVGLWLTAWFCVDQRFYRP